MCNVCENFNEMIVVAVFIWAFMDERNDSVLDVPVFRSEGSEQIVSSSIGTEYIFEMWTLSKYNIPRTPRFKLLTKTMKWILLVD